MSDLRRVTEWFRTGRLVRPGTGRLNFLHLVRALLRLAGAEHIPGGEAVAELERRIGPAEHYVFVLVDGLGANQLERLFPPEGFARKHLAGRLETVWPSTTAAALSSLATARWPGEHGVGGWWSYLPERDLSAVTLPFQERSGGRPLSRFGVRPEELFPLPSAWGAFQHRPLSMLPARLVGSVYSTWSRGATAAEGYDELADLPARIARRLRQARQPTLTYIYLPQLDELGHKAGPDSARVAETVPAVDWLLAALGDALQPAARLVVTADHGQVAVPKKRRTFLPPTDPLAAMLRCRPSGEPSVPFFHVVPGAREAFAEQFRRRFGERFALLGVEDVEQLRLMGPVPLSPTMRRRLGDFVGICPQPAKFLLLPAEPGAGNIGVHGGLTDDEMSVPLLLA